MSLNVSYNDLSVSLQSQQSLSVEMLTLIGENKFLKQNLADTVTRLEEAHYKIGFLQAQLLIQQEQINQLKVLGPPLTSIGTMAQQPEH